KQYKPRQYFRHSVEFYAKVFRSVVLYCDLRHFRFYSTVSTYLLGKHGLELGEILDFKLAHTLSVLLIVKEGDVHANVLQALTR
ncbi:MAG: hypothetical protein OEV74_22165, partial [Cyclobacteriaceae bacterium]|nr:hypothetical protein [Cyclobacteriaceae bacterium]